MNVPANPDFVFEAFPTNVNISSHTKMHSTNVWLMRRHPLLLCLVNAKTVALLATLFGELNVWVVHTHLQITNGVQSDTTKRITNKHSVQITQSVLHVVQDVTLPFHRPIKLRRPKLFVKPVKNLSLVLVALLIKHVLQVNIPIRTNKQHANHVSLGIFVMDRVLVMEPPAKMEERPVLWDTIRMKSDWEKIKMMRAKNAL